MKYLRRAHCRRRIGVIDIDRGVYGGAMAAHGVKRELAN
jgi:hypothetical protein